MNTVQTTDPTRLLPMHGELIHSPKRMLHFFAPDFGYYQSQAFSKKKKKSFEALILITILARVEVKNESEEGTVRFLQVLQMQRITICLWNVSYFHSAFNSFPNMIRCSSQAEGSDTEVSRKVVLSRSPAQKRYPRV